MPRYEITSPDGKKFEITAPDGATEAQVLSYAQEQFKAMPKAPPTTSENLAAKALPYARAMVRGGPMGVITEGVGQGMHAIDELGAKAGGVATDFLASRPMGISVPPEVSAGVGTATQLLPGAMIGGASGRAAAPAVRDEGLRLMQNALRPTKLERKAGDGAKAAQVMMDEGANVTEAGVSKLREKIGTLNDELQAALNSSPATVDKNAIASRLQDVIAKIETSTMTPQDRVKAVEKIYNDAIGNAHIPNQIPVALANRIKSGIYKEMGDLKYSRQRTGAPITDAENAQMALARGAKEEISAAVPSAAPLNAEMGKLINAADMAENTVLGAANRQPGGLAWLTHDLPRFLAMVVAHHPASKSIIARALYGNADTAATGLGAAGGATVGTTKRQ